MDFKKERLRRLSDFISEMIPEPVERQKRMRGSQPNMISHVLNQHTIESRRQLRIDSVLPPVVVRFQRAVSKLMQQYRDKKL